MEPQHIPLSPVVGWDVHFVAPLLGVTLRLDFLTTAMQQPEDAHHSPQYILTAPQARALADALQRSAALSESADAQGAGFQKH